MEESRSKLYAKCKVRLLKLREEAMNGLQVLRGSMSVVIEGDEGDMSSALETQHVAMARRDKTLRQLQEIDGALRRMEDGSYGICEETEEPIEPQRLLEIPYTRLSLHGAEMRELARKKFA